MPPRLSRNHEQKVAKNARKAGSIAISGKLSPTLLPLLPSVQSPLDTSTLWTFPRAISKRHATDYLGNQDLRAILAGLDVLHDLIDGTLVLYRQAAAEGIAQQLGRQ